jgi:hypothetical protein
VLAEAPLRVEIEISWVGKSVNNGASKTCVRLTGRVVNDGQRFLAPDTVKEHCDVTRFTLGGTDAISASIALAVAAVQTVERERRVATVESALYFGTVDDLVDSLSRQATRH